MTYLEKNEKREICLTCLFIDNTDVHYLFPRRCDESQLV